MSIHLMSLVWEIPFPTPTQKLTLLKLADHATDEGASIFPANETLAYQVGCDPRTIQRSIKALEQAEILKLLRRGGTGPKDTNQWQINVDIIAQLAIRDLVLVAENGCLQAVENKGDSLPPSNLARVTKTILRVTPVSSKGDTGVTQTFTNHQLESPSASADARDSSRTAHAVEEKPLTMFELTPKDVTWKTWLSLMEAKGRTDLSDAAVEAGKIQVRTKWPDSEKGLQGLIADKPKKTANYTDRMLGEKV